jgi:hypothetical protein
MPPRAKATPKKDPYETDIFAPGSDSVPDGDEAHADLPPWAGPSTNPTPENKETKKMTEEIPSTGKITVTLKGGNDFSQPWVVIHGSDPADLLDTFDDPDLVKVLERTRKASEFFVGTKPAPTPTQTTTTTSRPPQGATQGQQGAKFCQHGEMQYKTGFSQKTQKTWSGYFCPTPQGTPDQCPPQFSK